MFSFVSFSQEAYIPGYKPDPKVIRSAMLPPSRFGKLLFDLFEYYPTSEDKEARYDIEFWFGGDFNRLYVETEGEHSFKDSSGSLERLDLYYGRLISSFWDARIGVGTQSVYGDNSESRNYVVAGFQGLAPYWFEVDANLRFDSKGKITADLEAEMDILFTQRLILQPRFETLFAFSDIEELGRGSGLNSVELGLRLRYEIRREFAPYIGVNWVRHFGKTADLLEVGGEDTNRLDLAIGLRMWF